MARPIKCRTIGCDVAVRYFKPQGVPLRFLEEIELKRDEMEAMRLSDIEDMYQADAAEKMGVSRQTLGNILARAHKKVATALLAGKALRIEALFEQISPSSASEQESVATDDQQAANLVLMKERP